MFNKIKALFGSSNKPDFKELLKNGAQIIDVRTPDEFRQGHIKGSVNIPLQVLEKNLSRIRKEKPVITCCASGMRSASARNILQSKGYNQVYNGGGWMGLQGKLR